MLADTARDVEHPYLVLIVDQLEKITVSGDDIDRHRRGACQRPDYVISFVAILANDGDAQGIKHRQDQWDLHREPVGGSLTGGAFRA